MSHKLHEFRPHLKFYVKLIVFGIWQQEYVKLLYEDEYNLQFVKNKLGEVNDNMCLKTKTFYRHLILIC